MPDECRITIIVKGSTGTTVSAMCRPKRKAMNEKSTLIDWHGIFNGVWYKETWDPCTNASNVWILYDLILVFFSESTGPEQCLCCFSWLGLYHRKIIRQKGQNRMCPFIHAVISNLLFIFFSEVYNDFCRKMFYLFTLHIVSDSIYLMQIYILLLLITFF